MSSCSRLSEAQARNIFAQVQASGLSLYTWCQRNNFNYMVLYRWRIKLANLPAPASAAPNAPLPPLVEVLPPASPPSLPAYELSYGPWHLRFSGDFQPQQLQQILRILAC